MQTVQTVNLGAEYDEDLFEASAATLADEGATLLEKLQGVAGSQDVSLWKYIIGDDVIEVASETYMGLTITGPSKVVEHLEAAIRERLKSKNNHES
jgi:hypothetical protein